MLIDFQWKVEMEAVEKTRVAVVEKVQQLECSQKFQDEEDVAEPEEMVKLQALVLQDDDCQF